MSPTEFATPLLDRWRQQCFEVQLGVLLVLVLQVVQGTPSERGKQRQLHMLSGTLSSEALIIYDLLIPTFCLWCCEMAGSRKQRRHIKQHANFYVFFLDSVIFIHVSSSVFTRLVWKLGRPKASRVHLASGIRRLSATVLAAFTRWQEPGAVCISSWLVDPQKRLEQSAKDTRTIRKHSTNYTHNFI